MTATTQPHHVDLAAPARPRTALVALVLAILSVPGSLLPWDWFSFGGLVIGVPLAVAAIVVGVIARRDPSSSGPARGMALAAIVIGVAMLLVPVAWVAFG